MATFTQFVSDDTTPNEAITKGPFVPLFESSALSESVSRGTSRLLTESQVFTDNIVKLAGKFFSGAISLADALGSGGYAKLFSDAPGIVESISHHWITSASWQEVVSVIETISKNPAKSAFIETPLVLADFIGRAANKVVNELLNIVDSLFWPSNPRIMDPVDTQKRIMDIVVVGEE